jgi:excisionase family DNA binding protein
MTYHTTSTIAKQLGVKPDTVLKWIVRGKLKATKVGRDWVIEDTDLQLFSTGEKKKQLVRLNQDYPHHCLTRVCSVNLIHNPVPSREHLVPIGVPINLACLLRRDVLAQRFNHAPDGCPRCAKITQKLRNCKRIVEPH